MPRYGWRPDLPDRRDFVFMAAPRPGLIPEKMDLRAECPPIYDQGQRVVFNGQGDNKIRGTINPSGSGG